MAKKKENIKLADFPEEVDEANRSIERLLRQQWKMDKQQGRKGVACLFFVVDTTQCACQYEVTILFKYSF